MIHIVRILATTLLCMLVLATPIAAQEGGARWAWQEIHRRQYQDYLRQQRLRAYQAQQQRQQYPVYAYGPRAYTLEQRRQARCEAVQSAVGVEKYNLDEARESARQLWMERVKLDHGVKYMNPDNAIILSGQGDGPDCYLSATGTRKSEKAAEAVAGAVLHQCEFIAAPCIGGVDVRGR